MTEFLTPVGRMVAGDLFKGQDTDAEGKPLVVKHGTNAGQPRKDFFFALAIPKTAPEWPALYQLILAEAKTGFPQLFDAAGNCTYPAFAWKIVDGDSTQPNRRGIRPCDRPGYAGHYVLNLSSGFAPDVYIRNSAGKHEQATDPNSVKRGYFIRVAGSVNANGSQNQPGLYLNHSMVEFVAYGEEINTGPSAEAVFGGAAPALPPGASTTPAAPTTPPPTTSAPGAPVPANVTPAPDFRNPPAAPAATPPPAPAPAAPAAPAPAVEPKRMHPSGVAYTVDQLKASKWTDEQIAALPQA